MFPPFPIFLWSVPGKQTLRLRLVCRRLPGGQDLGRQEGWGIKGPWGRKGWCRERLNVILLQSKSESASVSAIGSQGAGVTLQSSEDLRPGGQAFVLPHWLVFGCGTIRRRWSLGPDLPHVGQELSLGKNSAVSWQPAAVRAGGGRKASWEI